ncbi:MAG: hypothetical protein AAF546_10025 [Verrucomicrobiota bacterium]
MKIALITFWVFLYFGLGLWAQTYSSLVFPGADGRLVYAGYANEGQSTTDNRMIDFSHAGYRGGGVAIPWVPVVLTLEPDSDGGDDTARIQAAIDSVAAMPLGAEGFRGAILLKAGSYDVSETLWIRTRGIVIRGEGQHTAGTVIRFTATVQDNLFEFEGSSGWGKIGGSSTAITDSLVPSGVFSFNVQSISGLSVGDRVMVHRRPNQAWIDLLDMGQWGWTPNGYRATSPRVITAIDGNRVSLDAPVVQAIESQYGGGELYRYQFDGAVREVGIESLRLESSYASETDEKHGWNAVRFSRVENGWARQVTAKYFGRSCVDIDNQSLYITVEDCAMLDPKSIITGGRRYSFTVDDSSFILMQRCYARGGRHDFATDSKTPGPVVFVDCLAENTYSDIGPHHRYSEGILFDNVKGGEINVQNRASSGSGHGWAGAQTVFWNCVADSFICDAPKAAMNFAIGCTGSRSQGTWAPNEPYGFWESRQVPVTPRSLYYKQLEDRLGSEILQLVTTQAQRDGPIWSILAEWQGETQPPGVPSFAPVQVDAGNDAVVALGSHHPLNAVIGNPLPESFPVIVARWTVVSGPGPVDFVDSEAAETEVTFSTSGIYELEYTYTQQDDSDLDNLTNYTGSDRVVLTVPVAGSILNPSNFLAIGSITEATAALSFDTDSLQVSGGLSGSGQLGQNADGSVVAVFAFDSINLATSPAISGSRPIVLISTSDFTISTKLDVRGGSGGHAQQGSGVAGGGDGGDANRSDSPGFPYDGQGPGGSLGNSSGSDDSTPGGGGFGGTGGDGTGPGGTVYGDSTLRSLVGGSGAGGSNNKGGGAGGGAIGLIAKGILELTAEAEIEAQGGRGASSGTQLTSGGGSGGAILLRGEDLVLFGSLDASGGKGGDAQGGQSNGGGGGGGRIALYYQKSIDMSEATVAVNGGRAVGSNETGQRGADGTVYVGLDDSGLADSWLSAERGILNPTAADWLIDYDGDGLSAIIEYALGGSTSNMDWSLLPQFSKDASGFQYFFNRRKSGFDLANYIVETSTSLAAGSWTQLYPDESLVTAHATLDDFDIVTVEISTDAACRFVRLRLRAP